VNSFITKKWEHEEYKFCNEFYFVTFAVSVSLPFDVLRREKNAAKQVDVVSLSEAFAEV
jgi:hypothetical protein